jgi:hypothetical protein
VTERRNKTKEIRKNTERNNAITKKESKGRRPAERKKRQTPKIFRSVMIN